MNNENIMSFDDGLNINIGEDSIFKITTGDICDCPESLIELIPNNEGCLDHDLIVHTDSIFDCDVLIDADLEVNGDTNLHGNVEIDGDVIFNGNVSGIDCDCQHETTKVVLLYKDKSVNNNSILALNGSKPIPNMPYIAAKKIKITKLKLLIGESDFKVDDKILVNLYEVKLNGLNGYDVNATGSVIGIHNINSNYINTLYTIPIIGANLDNSALGNRRYRYISIDVDINTTFDPSALIADVKTSIHGIDDMFLWVEYNNI